MPIFTTPNSFNVGQDISITIQHLESGVLIPAVALGHLMEFDSRQEDRELVVIPITDGGKPKLNIVYQGWSGHMIFTRNNGVLDALLSALEQNFYNARLMSHFNILTTITNRDGTVDQFLYKTAVLSRGTGGNWRADKETDERIDFRAIERVQTSGLGALIPTS